MQIAIVTGASSGLGAAFASAITTTYRELDEIWMIARRKERLETFAADHPEYRFRILAFDLAQESTYTEFARALQEHHPEIRVLINNAGYQRTGRFEDAALPEVEQMLNVNVLAATRIQRLCTPYLREDSISILTSSVLALAPTPGQAVYSASKSYLYSLGAALQEEYRGCRRGNVLVLCPGSMDTEMNPRSQNRNAQRFPFLYTDVDDIASAALNRAERGETIYTPGAFYHLYRIVSRIVPQTILVRLVGRVYGR